MSRLFLSIGTAGVAVYTAQVEWRTRSQHGKARSELDESNAVNLATKMRYGFPFFIFVLARNLISSNWKISIRMTLNHTVLLMTSPFMFSSILSMKLWPLDLIEWDLLMTFLWKMYTQVGLIDYFLSQ